MHFVDKEPSQKRIDFADKLKSNKLIRKISIRIEKPDAPLPHKGGLAVVEAKWSK